MRWAGLGRRSFRRAEEEVLRRERLGHGQRQEGVVLELIVVVWLFWLAAAPS